MTDQNLYIITENGIKGILDYFAEEDNDQLRFAAYDIIDTVKSNPYTPQAERGRVFADIMKKVSIREGFNALDIYRFSTVIEELRQEGKGEQGCKWIENEDGAYNTACGNCFEVMDGTPKKNNMDFCPYCGKELRQKGGE